MSLYVIIAMGAAIHSVLITNLGVLPRWSMLLWLAALPFMFAGITKDKKLSKSLSRWIWGDKGWND